MPLTDLCSLPAIPTDDECFAAVRRRDRTMDGRFVYAVRTTGVYCRPSCAARPARRENVSFHATCGAAERAGFRPCKRCRPDAASQAERHAEAVARACRLLEDPEQPPGLDAMAEAAGLSPFHFHRVFKRVTGVTPKAYADAARAGRMEAGLAQAPTVTDAIYEAGYNASSRFYEQAARRLGMTPGAYRRGGAGMTVRFAVGECSLGSILVAMSGKGVCAIALGDDPGRLVADLQARLPRAELIGADPSFEEMVSCVVGFVEDPARGLGLPLDIRGTAFQQRVWEALQAIPPGQTTSYAALAAAIGAPAAVRAVAGACAANALAVAIPCHRVVRSDGGLSDYRWGVERKQALLDRERRAA